MKQVTVLDIDGMTCGCCASDIRGALAAIAGVTAVDASVDNRAVTVTHDPEGAPVAQLIRAVGDAGYGARPRPESEACCAVAQ